MTLQRPINLDSVQLYEEPFPYFTANAILNQDSVSRLLKWFEFEAFWRLAEADFYEQYELDLKESDLQSPLSFLTSEVVLDEIQRVIASLFRRPFLNRVEWAVHKLLRGQRIRIHNDLLGIGETHRVILHINHGWRFSQGGFLMLFNSLEPADVHRVLIPQSGSLVGFEISEKSSHAVSLVLDGERFAVVYSLYADN